MRKLKDTRLIKFAVLTKIAEEQKNNSLNPIGRMAIGVGTLPALATSSNLVSQGYLKHTWKNADAFKNTDTKGLKNYLYDLSSKNFKLKEHFTLDSLTDPFKPKFFLINPKEKVLFTSSANGVRGLGSKELGYYAHELGHALNHRKLTKRFSKNFADKAFLASALGRHAGGLASSTAILAGLFTDDKDTRNKIYTAGAGLGALSMAPSLVDEFNASRNGIGILKRYFKKNKLKTPKIHWGNTGLRGGFGSYLLGTSALALSPLAARYLDNKFIHKDK